jgi:superfamily II DNA or RNA helicase
MEDAPMSDRPSPALRERVFARSDGQCQRPDCDAAITLETFHVAHLRARAHGGPVHESNLEAWCAPCNLTMGSNDADDRRLAPREWQRAALDGITDTIARSGAATVVAAPGAGKTVFAALVFEALYEAGLVDRMLVFVPRFALVDQWVEALAATRHLQLKPRSAIERDGQHGAVVTYQSLDSRDRVQAHRVQIERRRTLLVLDEVHHVGDRSNGVLPAWARNVGELAGDVEAHNLNVTGVLNLSGTLWRSARGERITTVRYRTIDDNRLESIRDFEVTVGELVGRGELRPIDLYRLGAQVRLADYQTLEHVEGDLADLDEKPTRAAMPSLASVRDWRTAFVEAVLDRLAWAHRALDGHHVKALIVANRQADARAFYDEVDRQMRERGLQPLAALAISDEPEAQDTLEYFRDQKRVGVLCTVDMAGEGYDCPDIAVIGYASNKLTSLYVRQVTARAMRVTDQERGLGRVIPAAVVVPDAQALVEQLVSYLAPFSHEVLLPENVTRCGDPSSENGEGGGEPPLLSMPRYVLEHAQPGDDGRVTIADHDGSRQDVSADLAQRFAVELERRGVPGIYSPRTIVAARTVGDLLAAARPFDPPSGDATALQKLADDHGAPVAAGASAESRPSTIEQQAQMLSDQLAQWAKWWQMKGDTPAARFQCWINDWGGIANGKRDSASVEQLRRARDAARRHISNYCDRTGTKPPKGWGQR